MPNKKYFLSFYLFLTFVEAKKELKFLHVLSTNKFYVPDYNYSSVVLNIPNNFTYKYYVENSLDIPSTAKVHLFKLGSYLRNTYNGFIPSLFMDDVMEMRTTQYSVSIIAGELINTGLWPPVESQIWKEDLLWQPIPFVYEPAETDTVLLGTLCPNFQDETNKVLKNHHLTVPQNKLLSYLKDEGGMNVTNPIEVALLYLALENSNELGQIRPNWLKKVFPSENLLNLTLIAYDLLSKTTIQKQLNGGSILKSIITNCEDLINGKSKPNRKINIYSGDDRNLAGVLKNLKIPFYELPNAGAALIFELISEDKNYFIKINYYIGTTEETIPYILEGCDMFCPIEKFTQLVKDVLPENDLSLCTSLIKPPHTGITSGGDSIKFTLILYFSLTVSSFLITYAILKNL